MRITVNTPPPAPAVLVAVPHGHTGSFVFDAATILTGLIDADGDTLTIAGFDTPNFGSLTDNGDGSFTYFPTEPNGLVRDDVQSQFRLSDGFAVGDNGVALFAVDNAQPEVIDYHFQAIRGTSGPFEGLLGTDADGDVLEAVLIDPPRHGTVAFETTGPDNEGRSSIRFSYLPTGSLRFNERFTFRVRDLYGLSRIGMFELLTNNSEPVAFNDERQIVSVSVATADSFIFNVLSNDLDADADLLFVVLASGPAHGTVTVTPDGHFFRYRPQVGFAGIDSFTYRASDTDLESNEATVTITVAGEQLAFLADDTYTLSYPISGGLFPLIDPAVTANDFIPADSPFVEYEVEASIQPFIGKVKQFGDDRTLAFEFPPAS